MCEMIKTVSKYPAAKLEGFLAPKPMLLTPNKPTSSLAGHGEDGALEEWETMPVLDFTNTY